MPFLPQRLIVSFLLYLPITQGHKPNNDYRLVSPQTETLKSNEEIEPEVAQFHTLGLKMLSKSLTIALGN